MSSRSENRALDAREFFSPDHAHYAEATFVPVGQSGQGVPMPVTVPGTIERDSTDADDLVGRRTVFRMAAADAELLGKDHAVSITGAGLEGADYIAAVIEPGGMYFSLVTLEATE